MIQRYKVLQYIQDFGHISTLDAFRDLGITRLSARIHDLKHKDNCKFRKERVYYTDRYGDKRHYDNYFLVKEDEE